MTDITNGTNANSKERVVLITARIEPKWLERLRNQWPNLRFEQRSPRKGESIPDELWREVEVLYMSFAIT